MTKPIQIIASLLLLAIATTGCGSSKDKTKVSEDKDLEKKELDLIEEIKGYYKDDEGEYETDKERLESFIHPNDSTGKLRRRLESTYSKINRTKDEIKTKNYTYSNFKAGKEEEALNKQLEMYKIRKQRLEKVLGLDNRNK